MKSKVLNKQISMEQIIQVADYLENYKEGYDKKFEIEETRNKNLPYEEKQWEYQNGSTSINYTIDFQNGKNIKENNYSWFVSNLNDTRNIKSLTIDLHISFYTKELDSKTNDKYNKINTSLYFKENYVDIDVTTTSQENEAHNIYSEIMNILENNEDRYNKTMKNRKIRTQCFTISVGIILSYILYVILRINMDKLPAILLQYINNKYILIFGQWFVSILLGNIFSYWYIIAIYRPLLPSTKYAGYDYSANRSKYKDDVDDYTEHSEVHFGQYCDAEKRRKKIEKIYKITSKIILVQILISIVLLLILK